MSSLKTGTAAFLTLFSLVLGFPAAASPAASETPGSLRVTGSDGTPVDMPLRHTKVSIDVTAFVARATVEQVFENPFPDPVEAVYTFPLGDRAAVDDFELSVGERTIRGEIRRRDEARQVYEQARDAGYQGALLEQERPNIFTQSVANLEPGKPITVRLRTVETLKYERGIYRLTFPLVVGPRYMPGGGAKNPARVTPSVLAPGTRSGHDVEIAVSLDAGVPIGEIGSSSHRIEVQRRDSTTASIRLAENDTIPNKDFLLRWSVSAKQPAVGLLAHRDGADGFFTLLVQPRGEVGPTEAAPKEIVFVVDTSGSMSGIPLDASKRLVARALHEMGPRDTFNVVRFSGDNEVFSPHPLPSDASSIESAIAWLNARQGGGGTEMLAAMRASFALPPDPNRMRIVVFFTDGYVGNDPEILGAIGKVVGSARIYTVGIGSSVNHYLLERMADLGHGAYVFVRPDESADDALDAFRSWVTRPYLTDLAIDWGALPVADLSPETLPDIGSGQTLTVVGRYLAGSSGTVTVRGKLGGRYWEQSIPVVLPDKEPRHEALGAIWARGRIEQMLLADPEGPAPSTEAGVTALALEFRLMSPFTSFVAVDDSHLANPAGRPRTVEQALPMPEGVSFDGVFGTGGPRSLAPSPGQDEPEDRVGSGANTTASRRVSGSRDRDFKGLVSGVSSVDPLTGKFVSQAASDSIEEVSVVTAGAGVEYGRARGGYAQPPPPPPKAKKAPAGQPVSSGMLASSLGGDTASNQATKFSSELVKDVPVAGRFYQHTLELEPQLVDGEGNAPSSDASSARARLREAALRVLADLADDGHLTASEGRTALAALLAAQQPSGAVAADVPVHVLATWALAEAAAALPGDPWVAKARAKAIEYLAGLAKAGTLPGRETPFALLVLDSFDSAGRHVPASQADLRKALEAVSADGKPPAKRSPADRLLASIGRGHLRIVSS